MNKLAIVEYGTGNLGSLIHACHEVDCDTAIVSSREELESVDATHILLPGVGAVGEALAHLRDRDMEAPLNYLAMEKRRPFLAICVGMQMLAESCEEFGTHKGLGWIPGATVSRLAEKGAGLRLPHVGWNTLSPVGEEPLLNGLDKEHFYYVHTYAMTCPDNYVIARCDYGGGFVCAVRRDNIYGVQFHPEKSSRAGAALLKNFLSC